MKLKKLLPLLLLTPILTQAGYAQPPTESKSELKSDYGIEPEKLYPGRRYSNSPHTAAA
jgi:hypothetical protein